MINEWEFEPNIMKFKHNGFNCLIKRQKAGHLTAYVLVNKDHFLYEQEYDTLHFILKDHNLKTPVELSFSDYMENDWAFGFGYSRLEDYVPNMDGEDIHLPEWMKEMTDFFHSMGLPEIKKEYRNLTTAIEDIKELADLIKKISIN